METEKELSNALINAVIANNPLEVQELLEKGAQPNYCEDDAEIRSLHFAALYNCPEVVPLLVMGGADIAALTDSDDTPLAIAKRHGHQGMINIINKYLHAGIDSSSH